jgi:hypothetical protein
MAEESNGIRDGKTSEVAGGRSVARSAIAASSEVGHGKNHQLPKMPGTASPCVYYPTATSEVFYDLTARKKIGNEAMNCIPLRVTSIRPFGGCGVHYFTKCTPREGSHA